VTSLAINTARGLAALGMILLDIVLSVVGLIVCLAPAERRRDGDGVWRTHWRWRWLWLWDNDEDGIDGWPEIFGKNPNWRDATLDWSPARRRWVWSAWRNRVNNMRRTRLGRSPDFPDPPKHVRVYLQAGLKFWLCIPLTSGPPWWELWLGWKPGAGFKSTITSLAKPGA
jgi:hypothetical protein